MYKYNKYFFFSVVLLVWGAFDIADYADNASLGFGVFEIGLGLVYGMIAATRG